MSNVENPQALEEFKGSDDEDVQESELHLNLEDSTIDHIVYGKEVAMSDKLNLQHFRFIIINLNAAIFAIAYSCDYKLRACYKILI
jgi:hypothetical protein